MLGYFQCRGVLFIYKSKARADCAYRRVGGGCLGNFSLLYRFCSLQLSPGDGSIKTEILLRRTSKPKTTNQHSIVSMGVGICISFFLSFLFFLCDGQGQV